LQIVKAPFMPVCDDFHAGGARVLPVHENAAAREDHHAHGHAHGVSPHGRTGDLE
jgi:hypothetical protein